MRTLRQLTLRPVLAAIMATTLAASTMGLAAAASDTGAAPRDGYGMEHRELHMQAELDRLAARLEIKASQQAAWQAFTSSLKAMAEAAGMPPGAHEAGDAAARARMAANRAADRAARLAHLADATEQLQKTLAPEQRLVLDEVARRYGERHHPGMHGPEACEHEGHAPHPGGMHEHPDGMSGAPHMD